MQDDRTILESENFFSFSQGKTGILSSNNKILNFSVTPSPKKIFDEDERNFFEFEISTGSQSTSGSGKAFSLSSKSNVLIKPIESNKTVAKIEIHKKKLSDLNNVQPMIKSAKNITSIKDEDMNELNKIIHSKKKTFLEDEESVSKKINDFSLEGKTNSNASDLKALTNTQDIRDFHEYTRDCIQNIKKIKLNDKTPKKIDLDEVHIKQITSGEKKLAIFDLDETLIHREVEGLSDCDERIEVRMPNKSVAKIGINLRPLLRESLKQISQHYILVLFTASQQIYADKVLELFDPKNEFFVKRLYRDSCRTAVFDGETIYVKDLNVFNQIPIEKVIIIDNSVLSFCNHIHNGIPILPFYDNKEDTELKDLVGYLDYLKNVEDVRIENKNIIALQNYYPDSDFNSSSDDEFNLIKESDTNTYMTNSSYDSNHITKNNNYNTNSSLSELSDAKSNQIERHQELFKCLEVFQRKYQKLKLRENMGK